MLAWWKGYDIGVLNAMTPLATKQNIHIETLTNRNSDFIVTGLPVLHNIYNNPGVIAVF